jgi:protein gp37
VGTKTGIQWTDATWNPVTGCTKVSRGCEFCYAEKPAKRLLGDLYRRRLPVVDTEENRLDPFAVRIWPERLPQPSLWEAPRCVFVNSMSDLFHSSVEESFIRRVFKVMLEVDQHVYQMLTKRPGRALRFLGDNLDLFPSAVVPEHIWIGASVEDQATSFRVGQLRKIPAQVRFLSCEPLLGPVELELTGIHWVIAGGESGPKRRAMDLAWARSIRDQCAEAGVPFFFKQVGGRTPKAGGRMLDGRTWDQRPAWPVRRGPSPCFLPSAVASFVRTTESANAP